MDAKLQEVLLDYGLEGYGLYWYCLELIAGNVTPENITFELEHDCRIIARNTGSTVQRIQEMMSRFIEINLFETSSNRIYCMNLAKKADDYTAKLVRAKGLQVVENTGVLETPTMSEKNPLEQNRLEENRIDNKPLKKPRATSCPYQKIQDAYNNSVSDLFPKCEVMNPKRQRMAKKFYAILNNDMAKVKSYFEHVSGKVSTKPFYTGENNTNWKANIEWMMREDVITKAREGNL